MVCLNIRSAAASDVLTSSGPPGLRITANRLFGPPPRNATYLCLWDFELGSIGGQCGLHLLHRLGGVKRAFTTTYADAENAPAAVYNPPTDPDGNFSFCLSGECGSASDTFGFPSQSHFSVWPWDVLASPLRKVRLP
jgi:hypothetical protein